MGATTFTVFTATATNRRNVFDAARNATISSAKICNSRVLPLRCTETCDLNPDGCFVSGRRELETVSATFDDGRLISIVISEEAFSCLFFRGSFCFSLGFLFALCLNFLSRLSWSLPSPRSWLLYRDDHRWGNSGAASKTVKLRG